MALPVHSHALSVILAFVTVVAFTLPAVSDDSTRKGAPALPTGVAPQYAYAFVSGDTLVLRMRGWTYEAVTTTVPKPDGGQQNISTYAARPYEYRHSLALAGLVAYEAGGTPLTPTMLRERLKADTPVIVAADQRLDPFFVHLTKDTAIVLVIPARQLVPPTPGRPDPAATMLRLGYKSVHLVKVGESLCVEAKVNGAAAHLEIDTGSNVTQLCADRHPGKLVTWRDAGRPFISAASGEKAPELNGELSDFSLREYRATRVKVIGVDAARAKYLDGHREKLAGVLGNDLLREMSAVIDCGAEILYYRPTGTLPTENTQGAALRELGYRPLRLRWVDGMYTVTGEVNGKSALLGLDTACASLVLAQDRPLGKQLSWSRSEPAPQRPAQVSEATITASTGLYTTIGLSFGEVKANDYPARGLRMGYLYDLVGNQGERMDGLLGKQELKWVWGLFDCKNGVLYHQAPPSTPMYRPD
jgi:hypothetical protein